MKGHFKSQYKSNRLNINDLFAKLIVLPKY